LSVCMASPLLVMTGPASSEGDDVDCWGSTELMAPLFQISKQDATATAIVTSRPIEHATRRLGLPC